MGTSFDLGFSQGTGMGEQRHQEQQQNKDAWRDTQAKFLQNAYDNAPDPQAKQQILEQYKGLYQPGDGPHLLRHLQEWAQRRQQPAPQAGPAISSPIPGMNANGALGAAGSPEGIAIPGQVGPVVRGPDPPSPTEAAKAPNGLDLIAKYYKSPEQTKTEEEGIKHKNTLEEIQARGAAQKDKPVLKAYKQKDGTVGWFNAADPDSIPEGATAIVPGTTPKTSSAALATYIRAKYGDNPTAEQIAQGTVEHQRLMAGVTVGEHQQLVFDDFGVPHMVTLHSESKKEFSAPGEDSSSTAAPKSSKTPSAPGVSASRQATDEKLNKKKSQSKQVGGGGIGFTKGNPEVKTDSAQYTKVAEDANSKEEAYKSAAQAIKSPSPSSDQELIYSWVRSNVQGAGRMTQAEFKQAASIGSLPERANNWYSLAVKGQLSPQIRNMMFADVKRSYETSKQESDTLRNRLSPKSKDTPSAPGDSDLASRLAAALGGK